MHTSSEQPHSKQESKVNRLSSIPVTLIALVILVCIPLSFWFTYDQSITHQNKYLLLQASQFSESIRSYRTFYSQTIVKRLQGKNGITVTHDYLNNTHSIPLPATFAKDYGRFFSDRNKLSINLYSDKPFPWRSGELEITDFEREALTSLQLNPEKPYSKIENTDDGLIVHYAVADVLSESCVGCHNSYPGTPKTDWKVGDVRGVLSISMPSSLNYTRLWLQEFGAIGALLAISGGLLLLMFRNLKTSLQREQHARGELRATVDQLQLTAIKNKTVFDSVHDAIIVIDKYGTILETNQSVFEVLGYLPNELIGQNVKMIVNDAQAVHHDGYLERFNRTSLSNVTGVIREVMAKCKDNQIIPVELTINAAELDGERLITGVVRDISERTRAEKELREAHQAALESAKVKSRFMANMSHEIRTPMNGISGMTQLLSTTQLNSQQTSYLQIINKSSKALMRIINDILDFSKIESGSYSLDKEWFPVLETLEENIDLMAEVAFNKDIDLSLVTVGKMPLQAYGDQGRIGQILNNLIHNAIKFTNQGGVLVVVRIDQTRTDTTAQNTDKTESNVSQATLHIEIKDSGSGIPQDKLNTLFDPFTQLDNSNTRQHSGTGLGLAICKELSELMGGQLGVVSEIDKGSVFTLELPLKTQDEMVFPSIQVNTKASLFINPNCPQYHQTQCEAYSSQIKAIGIDDVNCITSEEALKVALSKPWSHKQHNFIAIDIDLYAEDNPTEKLKRWCEKLTEAEKPHIVLYGTPKLVSKLGKEVNGRSNKIVLISKPIKPSIMLKALIHIGVLTPGPELQQQLTTDQVLSTDQSPNASDKSLLIVEDNDINYMVVAQMLKTLHYTKLTRAINGEHAIEALRDKQFDLVLMDCQMPVMDGYTATEIYREQEAALGDQHTPIIALTANVLKEDQNRCLDAGMDDYLGKPLEMTRLANCMTKWLKEQTNHPTETESIS